MKTLTFKYTKRDGSVSERTLLSFIQPTDKYAGIDLSELDPEDAQAFIEDVQDAYDDFLHTLNSLQDSYDVVHNYRQFLKDGVSELTEI